MVKTQKTRRTSQQLTLLSEPEIRAAMGKAIREVRRNAEAKNMTLAVVRKKSWSVPHVTLSSLSPRAGERWERGASSSAQL